MLGPNPASGPPLITITWPQRLLGAHVGLGTEEGVDDKSPKRGSRGFAFLEPVWHFL